eukprot:764169-Hanusia_phi.AAC.2
MLTFTRAKHFSPPFLPFPPLLPSSSSSTTSSSSFLTSPQYRKQSGVTPERSARSLRRKS